MKIETGIPKLNTESVQGQGRLVLKQGQTITGKIVESTGGNMEIITPSGDHISARIEGSLVLPRDTMLTFQTAGQREGVVILKLVGNSPAPEPSGEPALAGLAAELGITPTSENLEFLRTGSYMFGRNIERLAVLLQNFGRTDLLGKLVQILVSPGNLVEYMKGFNKNSGEKLVQKLEELFEEIKKSSIPEELLKDVMGSMVKGMHIQLNHPFPLFYIPIPLVTKGMHFNGELWIEKDKENESSSTGTYLYLIIDTPSIGKVEARIIANLPDISIGIGCSRESLPLLQSFSGMLEKRISSLGVNVKGINVSDAKWDISFPGLVKKYVKPFEPLDIRV